MWQKGSSFVSRGILVCISVIITNIYVNVDGTGNVVKA